VDELFGRFEVSVVDVISPRVVHRFAAFQREGTDFRVGGVYKNCYISCYLGKERIIHRKRPVVAPGEMEQIKLTKEQLLGYSYADKITLKIEEA